MILKESQPLGLCPDQKIDILTNKIIDEGLDNFSLEVEGYWKMPCRSLSETVFK
jgi:hypothetical protein